MNVIVNGEPRQLEVGATVASVVALLGAGPGGRGVAVALDGQVVTRSEWPDTELRDGALIEVVAAIGGG